MKLVNKILALFRCRHYHIGFPVTKRGTRVTTVLCQDCGAHLSYDPVAMKQGERVR